MAALPPDTSNARLAAPQRRAAPLRRRVGNAALGAVSGGVAGWLSVLLAGVDGVLPGWIIGGLAALGAGFGYRYGRGVAKATFTALYEAADD